MNSKLIISVVILVSLCNKCLSQSAPRLHDQFYEVSNKLNDYLQSNEYLRTKTVISSWSRNNALEISLLTELLHLKQLFRRLANFTHYLKHETILAGNQITFQWKLCKMQKNILINFMKTPTQHSSENVVVSQLKNRLTTGGWFPSRGGSITNSRQTWGTSSEDQTRGRRRKDSWN